MSARPGSPTIVTVAERPDLVPLVARWIWTAFSEEEGTPLAPIEALVADAAAGAALPQTVVLLVGDVPVGTASLVAHDLDERPDLAPWLASVFVHPDHRGQGHVDHLVRAIEAAARQAGVGSLWLYTNTAEPIYARLGWRRTETVVHRGRASALMRRDFPALP